MEEKLNGRERKLFPSFPFFLPLKWAGGGLILVVLRVVGVCATAAVVAAGVATTRVAAVVTILLCIDVYHFFVLPAVKAILPDRYQVWV